MASSSKRVRSWLLLGSSLPALLVGCATAEELDTGGSGPWFDGGTGTRNTGGLGGAGGGGFGNQSAAGGSSPGGGANGSGGGGPGGGSNAGGGVNSGGGGTTSPDGGENSAGTTGSGGASSGGGTGAGGTAPCTGSDADGDGTDDCTEDGDGDPWTDKAVFNGFHVRRGTQCTNVGACSENDTFAEVTSCMQNVAEELDQYAGWDWENPPDDVCDSRYGFAPNWTKCSSTWSAEWTGCVHFSAAGAHCFEIVGGTSEGCAALYFDGNTANADTQSGKGVKCFDLPAGNHPLMLHYTMDNGSSSSMHVRYCEAASGSSCTPTEALRASMLRPACP